MFFKRRRKITYKSRSELLTDSNIEKKVSFCISHKNRVSYLKQTLAKNLEDNASDQNIVEFTLVDFDSTENIDDWIKAEFSDQIKRGYLKYYRASGLDEWHASIAKNTTHFLGTGAILVNLDCDNFTGPNGGTHVLNHFENKDHNIILWQYSNKKLDGSFGRIAMTKDGFDELCGYNEALLPMGYQDGDLRNRLEASGLELVQDITERYNAAIQNEKYIPQNMSWKTMNETNQKTSKRNIKNNILTANDRQSYGIRENILKLDPVTLEMTPFLT